MDFGFTDDQREIQRTARELLAERAKPERVREHAEARTTDEALWRELCELGWPGIAISEEYGGRASAGSSCRSCARSSAARWRRCRSCRARWRRRVIEQAGSPEQRERWLPGLASGETIGALGERATASRSS